MTDAADTEIDRVLHDLESDSPASRREAVMAVVRLGDRAVRAIPMLQRMADGEVTPELRHIARKGLHLLALDAHLKTLGAPAAPPPSPALPASPGGKSAKITNELARESLPVVTDRLNSPDPNVRASALRATALRGEKLLLPALLERLGPEREPDPELRAIQVRVLAILGGKDQLKAVASFLEDPDPSCRTAAVDVLSQYRDVMAFPFIVRSLQDPDPRTQQRAASALAKVGPVNILKICELMIRSDRAWSRDAAVFCMALAALPESVGLLAESLKDPEASVQRKARMGLEKLAEKGNAAAREALTRAGSAALEATTSTTRIAPVVETRPADDLGAREPARRRAAAKELAALDGALDESHLPGLLERLDVETDVLALVSLLKAIGRIKSATILPVLSKRFVTHPDETVRAAAVDALAALGTPEALEPVRPLLEDTSPVVIGRALVALKSHAGVDVVAEVTRMASHAEPEFRTTAIYVMTELGDDRLGPALAKLTRDPVPAVATLAQDTSEILAEDLKAKLAAKRAKFGDISRVQTRPNPISKLSGATTRPSKPVAQGTGAVPIVAPPDRRRVLAAFLAVVGTGCTSWGIRSAMGGSYAAAGIAIQLGIAAFAGAVLARRAGRSV